MSRRRQLARVAAPAAFLVAATIAVLLVRSALDAEQAAGTTPTETVATAPATTGAQPPAAPPPPAPPPPASPPPAPPPPPPPPPAPATTTYTIQNGDTLESIANQYGTTVEQLLELNPGVDPVNLSIGQQIQIPQ